MTAAFSQKLAHLKAGVQQGMKLDDDRVLNLFEDVEGLLYEINLRLGNIEQHQSLSIPPLKPPIRVDG